MSVHLFRQSTSLSGENSERKIISISSTPSTHAYTHTLTFVPGYCKCCRMSRTLGHRRLFRIRHRIPTERETHRKERNLKQVFMQEISSALTQCIESKTRKMKHTRSKMNQVNCSIFFHIICNIISVLVIIEGACCL